MDALAQSHLFSSPPSNLSINDQEEIDRGAYGSVYPGELAGNPVAIKRIHPTLLQAESEQGRRVRQDFKAECQRLKDIGDHPNVVGFLGAYQDGKGPILVMEKMSQNLQKFLEINRGSLRLQQQLQMCLDIATGLEFLHSQNPPVVHRDLSARNVLLDATGRAKIGDLGQSKLKTASFFQTRQPGAVPYMPPEALRDQPLYNEKVDIFSFGVLMLEIATQSAPSSSLEGINVVLEEDRRRSDLELLPEDHPLKPLIRVCLKNNPAGRPDAGTLIKNLQEMHQRLFPLASVVLTQAKDCFIRAIGTLQESCCDVMKLAKKTRSPEFQVQEGLSIARLGEILKIIERMEMKVVFFGRTSNGKSTVINALLKSKVLPFGAGSTTTAICYIRGQDTQDEGGCVKCGDDDSRVVPVQSAKELARHMKDQRVVQIYWSTAQCSMLKGDIVLVDCPGMNAESEMDVKVIECCSDADVFVYVASGFTTFETAERELLAKVKEKISRPSNTFILFNHWDRVLEDGEEQASEVKQQQLSKVNRIMVEELGIFTEEMVEERTFFISAKQAVNHAVSCAANAQQTGDHLQQDFIRFERMLQECLFETAIKTKFGRHYIECQPILTGIETALTRMKHRWTEERDATMLEKKEKERLLDGIDTRLQCYPQLCDQKMQHAFERIAEKCDVFHSESKALLPAEINNYRPVGGFDFAKVPQYCEEMKRLLEKKFKNKETLLMQHWSDVVANVVLSLSDPLLVKEGINRLAADKASSVPGCQDMHHQGTTQTGQGPAFRQRTRRSSALIGGGVGAGIGTAVGVGMGVALTAVSLVVATPLGAALGAAAVGSWFYASWQPVARVKEEMRQQLMVYLDDKNAERKKCFKTDLEDAVKSSIDVFYMHTNEQKQKHEEIVGKLEGKVQDLDGWLSEACCLEGKVKEIELQLSQFNNTWCFL